MHSERRSRFILFISIVGCAFAAQADFEPIELTGNSYNHDVIIERTAPPPVVTVTTGSMEEGMANKGCTWFERGYLPDWPATGLPPAGSILTSDQSPDYQYQMPSSYETNNAILVDSQCPTASFQIRTPMNCAGLSFLTSSGIGRNRLRYTVHYQNGGNESGTFTSPNWYNDGNPACATSGKINVITFAHGDITSYNPRLYSVNVTLSETASPITAIDLSLENGIGHTAVFAVSGTRSLLEPFRPLDMSGFTADLVVEAKAIKPGFMETNTTATMENGAANSGFTWYEQGYNPGALTTGLPPAGSLITNQNDLSLVFRMATNYAAPNTIIFNSKGTNPIAVLARQAKYAAIAFLTSSSGGAISNQCVFHHADGNTQTNQFESPDWLSHSGAMFTAHGRVSVSTRMLADENNEAQSLYCIELPVIDQISPITQMTFSALGKSTTGQTVIFAIAGKAAASLPPSRPLLTIRRETNGELTVQSSQSGRLESCSIFGTRPYWRDEGPILDARTLIRSPLEPVRFYRVIIQ